MATDNFLEKYMPFKIQSMISDNIFATVEPIEEQFDQQKQQLKELQKRIKELENMGKEVDDGKQLDDILKMQGSKQKKYLKLKEIFTQHEFQVYKGLHKVVMKDHGIPLLKKRGFVMPGQKKVLSEDEREEYK